jgi:hypothetical protein
MIDHVRKTEVRALYRVDEKNTLHRKIKGTGNWIG